MDGLQVQTSQLVGPVTIMGGPQKAEPQARERLIGGISGSFYLVAAFAQK